MLSPSKQGRGFFSGLLSAQNTSAISQRSNRGGRQRCARFATRESRRTTAHARLGRLLNGGCAVRHNYQLITSRIPRQEIGVSGERGPSLRNPYRQRTDRGSLMQVLVSTPHCPVSAVGGSSTRVPVSVMAGGATT